MSGLFGSGGVLTEGLVGSSVGWAVGFLVGSPVGLAVGSPVGLAVGLAVGFAVGSAVGLALADCAAGATVAGARVCEVGFGSVVSQHVLEQYLCMYVLNRPLQ